MIKRLRKLQILKLDSNDLKTIPFEIGELSNVILLDLSDNQLRTLPDTLGQCSCMKNLNLSHNKLSYLPAELDQLRSLESLLFEDNEIVLLPCSLSRLISLKALSCDWLKLSSFETTILKGEDLNAFLSVFTELCNDLLQKDQAEVRIEDFLKHFNILSRSPYLL